VCLALLLLCVICTSQTPAKLPSEADYSAGLALIAQLKGSPDSDAPAFQKIGAEQSTTELMAVVARGQAQSATTVDWTQMHRALDALIELFTSQGQLFKASLFANLQAVYYESDEADYEAALAASRQALALQIKSGESKTLYIPYKNVGEDLIRLGRIEEGLDSLRHAHQIAGDPGNSVDGIIMGKIVEVELSQQDMEAAHRDSAAFGEAASHSPSKLFRGRALLAQSSAAVADNRYDDAVTLIHAALAATKDDADSKYFPYEATTSLLMIGMSAMETVPYAEALTLCGRIDKEFPDLPISVSGFARQIRDHRRRLAGDFDALLREQTEQVDRAAAAKDPLAEASALLTLSVDYAYLNESTQQIASLERALVLDRSGPGGTLNVYLHYDLLNSLGSAYLARKDARHARAAFDEITKSIDGMPDATSRARLRCTYADAELGKAAVAALDEDPDTARKIFANALLPSMPGAPAQYTRSAVLLENARFERNQGKRPAETLQLYQEAIAALHAEKDARTEISARMQLIRFLAVEAPQLPDAQKIAAENLELAKAEASSIVLSDAQWRLHFLDGILAENAGHNDQALAAYLLAQENLNRIRTGLSKQEMRQSFMDDDSVQELYRRLIALLTVLGEKEQAWEYLERDKARVFLESLGGRHFADRTQPGTHPSPHSSIKMGAAADLDKLEQQIIDNRVALAPENESLLRASGRQPELIQSRLKDLEAQFALIRESSELSANRATQPLSLRPISLPTTEAQLPAGTALIEYAIFDHELAAFVVTHSSAKELHWAVDTKALPNVLGKLNTLLSSPHASEDLIDTQLSSVSEILLAPVIRVLAPQIDSLIVVPTQSLSLVPFQALPLPDQRSHARGFSTDETALASIDPASRTLVIDRFAVAYLPSSSSLQFLHFGHPVASPDLFLGAIGDLSVEGLPALPGTLEETAMIQKLYPRASRVTGSAFTHDAAIKALLDHQEVHFATHGLFEQQAPLFSALITAPAPNQPTRLSLYELMDLNLKARLVILSACETDRGQLAGGDEVSGLTRTFLQAGAESVVSSLWSVSDESTALLMESLHAHLRAGESTPLALRHAELQVRRKFSQPYYWAAFVSTGVD